MTKNLGRIHWKEAIRRKIIHPNLLLDKCPKDFKRISISSNRQGDKIEAEIILDRAYYIEKTCRHLAYYCDTLEECLALAKEAYELKQEKNRLLKDLTDVKTRLNI